MKREKSYVINYESGHKPIIIIVNPHRLDKMNSNYVYQ